MKHSHWKGKICLAYLIRSSEKATKFVLDLLGTLERVGFQDLFGYKIVYTFWKLTSALIVI